MNRLGVLGITDEQERIYDALLEQPGTTVPGLAAMFGSTKRELERELTALEDRGLITRTASRPSRCVPTPPEIALRALVLRRQDELESVAAHAVRLQERFRRTAMHHAPIDLVEVITGFEAAAQRAYQLRNAAREENLIFDKPPYAEGPAAPDDELAELARGVRVRVIYDSSALEAPNVMEEIERLAQSGEESRVLANLPLKGGIFDRRSAIVPLASGAEEITGAIVIHASPMLDAMVVLFEILWQRATPLAFGGDATESPDSMLDPRDRRILSLLAAGYTDDAISRLVKVGDRTVGRAVTRLMHQLGVATRFQLGAAAARLGWLPDA